MSEADGIFYINVLIILGLSVLLLYLSKPKKA